MRRTWHSIECYLPASAQATILYYELAKYTFVITVTSPTDPVKTHTLFSDSYDVIAIAGGMGEGHIPCSALSEMVRVVTPGETPLRWRHNGHHGVSNHHPHDCLHNRLFRHRSKKTSKPHVPGLCMGNSPGTGEFPAQMASYVENFSIWRRIHDIDWLGYFTDIHMFYFVPVPVELFCSFSIILSVASYGCLKAGDINLKGIKW